MKSWLVFLLTLVLAGSLVPCCPSDNCSEETLSYSQPQEEDDEHSSGACSPFFACGTCSGFVQLATQYSITVPAKEHPDHTEKQSAFFTSSYYASFFQPPRL